MSEICYLYPVYLLAAFGLGYTPSLMPWFLPVLAAVTTVLNLKFAGGAYRYLTIAAGNLAVLVTAAFTLAMSRPAPGVADTIIIWMLLLLVFFRAVYLSRRTTDIFLHFDLSAAVIFLVLLITGIVKAPLAGGTVWLAASFLLNIVAISLARGGGEADGHLPWLGAVVASVVLIPLFMTARSFFPYLFQPARFLYELGRPVAGMIQHLILIFISFWFRFNTKTAGNPQESADSGFSENAAGALADSPWFAAIVKVIFWGLLFIIIVAGLAGLLYLLGVLIKWLLKRQVVPAGSGENTNLFSWRQLFRALYKAIVRIGESIKTMILPWLPGRIGAAQAYRVLLKWGLYRRCPRISCETPYEYQDRLILHFPGCRNELAAITASYVRFRYGKEGNRSSSSRDLKLFLRRLFLPRLKTRRHNS